MNNITPIPLNPRPQGMADVLDAIAAKQGKTTIMQRHGDNGGVLVWVTAAEADPMTALMSAALSIMIRRGHSPDSKSGVTIRRMTEGLIAPGCEVFWQVTDMAGKVVKSGYSANEAEASAEVAKYMKLGLGR